MTNTQIAGLVLVAYGLGGVSALLLYLLLRQPRPTSTPVEGIDGLDDALASAGRDLPTQRLPQPRPGTVYPSRHRRTSKG